MKKKLILTFLSLAAVLLAIFSIGKFSSDNVQAAEIPMTGNTGADASVTDGFGNAVGQRPTYTWESLKVSYNWSIPDGVQINSGDTAQFTLPDNVVAQNDLDIPILNAQNEVIGTFSITKGQSTGTITFNDALSSTTANRTGTLQFTGNGTQQDDRDPNPFVVNKGGWVPGQRALGAQPPTRLTWNVAFNSSGEELTNVEVTDTLGPNQTYVPGSVYAETGYYLGGWQSTGTIQPDRVVVNGNQVVFYFNRITTAVDMRFQVDVPEADVSTVNRWHNDVTFKADQISSSSSANIEWGGSGEGTGNTEFGNVILKKTNSANGNPVAGASFQLRDAVGNILQQDLQTDENGELAIRDLRPGNYVLVETGWPTGYEPSANDEHPFTIVAGQEQDIELTATNTPYPDITEPSTDGDLIFFKIDSESKEALGGAVFNLVDSKGDIVASDLTTDEQGVMAIPGLPAGDYSLVETKAPEGYVLDPTPIKFTITAGQVTNLYSSNKKEVTVVTPPVEPGNPEPGNPEPENPNPPVEEPENPGNETNVEQPSKPDIETPIITNPSITNPGVPTGSKGSSTTSTSKTNSGRLPQTSENQNIALSVLGIIAAALASLGAVLYKRRSN